MIYLNDVKIINQVDNYYYFNEYKSLVTFLQHSNNEYHLDYANEFSKWLESQGGVYISGKQKIAFEKEEDYFLFLMRYS